MLFVIYRMFVIRKIAKNGITFSKNNERLVSTFSKVLQKFHCYQMFAIRNFVLFTLRYSLFGIVCYLLFIIWNYMLKLYG